MKFFLKLNLIFILFTISNQIFATEQKPSSIVNAKGNVVAAPTATKNNKERQGLVKKCKGGDSSACFELEPDISKNDNYEDLGAIPADGTNSVKLEDLPSPQAFCEGLTVRDCDQRKKKMKLKSKKINDICYGVTPKACKEFKKRTGLINEKIFAPPTELEKCQAGMIEICRKNYEAFLKKSKLKEASSFLVNSCANDDYKACSIVGSLLLKAGSSQNAEGYFKQGVIGADKFCLSGKSEACEFKCSIMANLNSSAYDLSSCLELACKKGRKKSCEVLQSLHELEKRDSEEEHQKYVQIKRKMEEENQESERRAALFNGLSQAASKMGSALAGTNNSNNNDVEENSFKSQETSYTSSGGCGFRPIPKIGCRIGRCIDGSWEQVCDNNSALECGIRPIPKIGCRIGRCVDGAWEQVCDNNSALECGIKPIPKIGCHIGRCANGAWEQVCN